MNPLVKKSLYLVAALTCVVFVLYLGQIAMHFLNGDQDALDEEVDDAISTDSNEHEIYENLKNNDEFYRVETEDLALDESLVLLEEALNQAQSTSEQHHIQFMFYKLKLYTEEGPTDAGLISEIVDFSHNIQVSNVIRASTLALLERRYHSLLKRKEGGNEIATELRRLTFADERLSEVYVEGSPSETTKNFNEYIFGISPLPDVGLQVALMQARAVSAEVLLSDAPRMELVEEWREEIESYVAIADREIASLKNYLEETSSDEWSLYKLGNADRLYLSMLTMKAETLMHLSISSLADVDDPVQYFEEAMNTSLVTLDSNRYFLKTYAVLEYAEYLVNREYYFEEDHSEKIRELTERVIADDQMLPPNQRLFVRGEIARMEFDENERYYYEEMAKKNPAFESYLLNEVGWESVEPLLE